MNLHCNLILVRFSGATDGVHLARTPNLIIVSSFVLQGEDVHELSTFMFKQFVETLQKLTFFHSHKKIHLTVG